MYDFLMFYIIIFYDKLKFRFFDIIDSCFFNKNGSCKNVYFVIGNLKKYFVKNYFDCIYKYFEVDIKKMFEFLIDNIYVVFGN